MPQKFPDAGYFHFFKRTEGSKKLLVVFSHLGVKPPKFAWFKALAHLDANLLFVNCTGSQWYRGGIRSLSADGIAGTLAVIRRIAAAIDPNCQVYMAGGSMGGYGALLYGSLYGARGVFASAAETILGIEGGMSTVLTRDCWSHIYPDLRVIAPLDVRRTVVFGDMHLVDTLSAGLFLGAPSTTVHGIDGGDHGVSNLLAQRNELAPAIDRMIHDEPVILDAERYPAGFAAVAPEDNAWFMNYWFQTRKYVAARRLADDYQARFPNIPLPVYISALSAFHLRQDAEAERLLLKTRDFLPDFAPTYTCIGAIRMRQGAFDAAVELLRAAVKLDPNPSMPHFQLGLALERAGNRDEAGAAFRAALAINPDHANYRKKAAEYSA